MGSLGASLAPFPPRCTPAYQPISREAHPCRCANTNLAKELPPPNENLRAWLLALTDDAEGTHDVQRFSDEAATERLQELSLKNFPVRR